MPFSSTALPLLLELLKQTLGTVLGAGLLFVAFHVFFTISEKKWLKRNGVILYLYFRTIDWRCRRIRRHAHDVTASGFEKRAALILKRELQVLLADLAALDRMVEMWADRVSSFPVWYPYCKLVNNLLTKISELVISLERHTNPTLFQLEISDKPLSEVESEGHSQEQLLGYLAYFGGGPERIWNHETASVGPEKPELAILIESGLLENRLEAVLELFMKVFLKANISQQSLHRELTENWPEQGPWDEVWYRKWEKSGDLRAGHLKDDHPRALLPRDQTRHEQTPK